MKSQSRLLKYGIALIIIAIVLAHLYSITFLSLMFIWLTPNLFLIGLVLLCSHFLQNSKINRYPKASLIILFIVLGLNTRIPNLFEDYLLGSASQLQINARYDGKVGQAIHIVSDVKEIYARKNSSASIEPACYGDGCFAFDGYRTQIPKYSPDYWVENIREKVLLYGFSLAQKDEKAPTLRIQQTTDGNLLSIQIELIDVNGKITASYKGRYRNGFHMETKDREYDRDNRKSLLRIFEFLIHGNFVSKLAGVFSPNGSSKPLDAFLEKSVNLIHPQGDTISFKAFSFSKVIKQQREERVKSAKEVTLEIIDSTTYSPEKIISKGDDIGSSFLYKSVIGKDEYCEELIKPEISDTGIMQTWHVFTNDITKSNKISFYDVRDVICNSKAIWISYYKNDENKILIRKYSHSGNLIYQVAFNKPDEVYVPNSKIVNQSLKFENGYAYFDWLDYDYRDQNVILRRSIHARIKEPN